MTEHLGERLSSYLDGELARLEGLRRRLDDTKVLF